MVSDKRGLDQERIARAAVELLDEEGLAGLTTRRLAHRLGVRSPTLYWHVRDKAALLDLVAEAICADAFDIDDTLPWTDQLTQGLRQFRQMLLAHRDAATLLRMRPPTGQHRLAHIETTLRILLEAGFSKQDAAGISRMLANHVLSSIEADAIVAGTSDASTVWLTDLPESLPNINRVAPVMAELTGQRLFDLGVEIIIIGLHGRLGQRTNAPVETQT